MSIDVQMPQMGESVVEGTVEKWLVKEGDLVVEDQPLVAISTDKVDTEIPSPSAGRIAKIVAAEGQTLPVGATLAVIETAPASAAQAKPAPAPSASVATPAKSPQPASTARPATMRAAEQPEPDADAPRRYSPVVMKIAAEEGIDLGRVPGTGIGGRVSKRDLQRYLDQMRQGGAPPGSAPPSQVNGAAQAPPPAAARPPAAAPPPASAGIFRPPIYQPVEGDTVEPFTRRRKLIAEHMVYSKTHSPHVGTVAEVDVTKAMRIRAQHRSDFERREGFALTFLPLAAAAVVRALMMYPRMNASVVGDSVVVRGSINLGIAMDTEEGLLVPVIKAAEGMSVVGLARAIEAMRRKVADKKINADDLSGGSFTLSNPGREGNLYGFAIINQPQVGILRMGEVKKRAVVLEVDGADAIAIRTMMYLALSYDHRVIDGVLGNSFLFHTARILEQADFEF